MTRLPRLTRPLGGLVLTAALALAATACGKEEPKQPAISEADLATASIASQLAVRLETDQALCTAKALVKDVGSDKLHKSGLLTDDNVAVLDRRFDRTTASALADATVACWDWRKHTETLASLYPKADTDAWDAYVACADKLDDKLRASVTEANAKDGKASAQTALAAAEAQCRKPLGKPATAK
jgi:hypothetical protein